MAVNAGLIGSLQPVETVDTANPLLAAAQVKRQNDAIKRQTLNDRDKRRLDSVAQALVGVNSVIESGGNVSQYLQNRRAELGQRIAKGEDVDTRETDEAIQMYNQDPGQFKSFVKSSIDGLQQLGYLKNTESKNSATDTIIKNLMAENPGLTYAQALQKYQTGFRSGTQLDQNGAITQTPGYLDTREDTKYAESKGATSGKNQAEAEQEVKELGASLPQLEQAVGNLKQTAQKATYTVAGQAKDAVARQFGVATEGAQARTDYISEVRDNVLPLLRQTFGAAFTAAEGESLLTTFGDPNKTPEEKVIALENLIETKKATLETKKRVAGQQPPAGSPSDDTPANTAKNPNGKIKFLGFE